jgi:hypothetical protein
MRQVVRHDACDTWRVVDERLCEMDEVLEIGLDKMPLWRSLYTFPGLKQTLEVKKQ